jgi:hypothetical protein
VPIIKPGIKPGVDKATGRVVALIVLLIIVAAALRGYLPAYDDVPRVQLGGGRLALGSVVVALSVTLTLLAIAIIARLRDPRAMAPRQADLSALLGKPTGRPSWRVLLIGLAVIVAWLLIVMLLARLWTPHEVAWAPTPDPSAPPSANGTAPPPQQLPRNDTGNMFGILLAGAIPMLLLIVAGAVITWRRRWRASPSGTIGVADDGAESPVPPKRSESLARAAERGLAEMVDLRREPREAIIACYAAMERELANVPGAAPRDFDTPTEVLARAVERHALHADNAIQLVNLFAEARFSPHVMNEGHRELAVRVLQLVLDELGLRSTA